MTRSFWIDEILTYQKSSLPLADVFRNNYYPLAYYLGHLMLQLGDTEFLFRFPSYLAGVLAVWLIYYLGKACHGRLTGLTASFLLAFNSLHIFFSQEARFYSLMTLAAVFCLWAIIRLVQEPSRLKYQAGLVGSIIFGSLSHPFFLPFLAWAGLGGCLGVLLRPSKRGGKTKDLVRLAICAGIGLMPLAVIYWLEKKVAIANLVNTGAEGQRHYLMTWEACVLYLRRMLLFQDRDVAGLMLALTLAGAILLILRHRWRVLPLYTVSLFLMPVFIVVPVTHWFNEKYFIGILPTLMIFVAVTFVEVVRWIALMIFRITAGQGKKIGVRRWAATGVLSSFLLLLALEGFTASYYGANTYASHWQVSWKMFAENMKSQMSGDDIIVHYAPPQLNPYAMKQLSFEPSPYTFDFYLSRQAPKGRADLYPVKHLLTGSAEELDGWLRQYPDTTFWLVHTRTEPMVPLSPAQQKLFQHRLYGYGSILMVAGRPTRNLVINGDMNSSETNVLRILGNAKLETKPNATDGDTYLSLSSGSEGGDYGVQIPLSEDMTTGILTGRSTKGYVLSMELKYRDIEGSSVRPGALEIALVGTDVNDKVVRIQITNLQGQSDWQFHSYSIPPQLYPDLLDGSKWFVEILTRKGKGTVSLDKVQLEFGLRPTPFVDNVRPDHRTYLEMLP